jgi:hypothetical protein
MLQLLNLDNEIVSKINSNNNSNIIIILTRWALNWVVGTQPSGHLIML